MGYIEQNLIKRRQGLLLVAFLSLVVMLVISCSRSQKLTDKKAMEMIRKSVGYPKTVTATFHNVKPNSPLGQEIKRLVREGYIIPFKSYWAAIGASEEGGEDKVNKKVKSIIKGAILWHGQIGEISFYTHKKDVVKIKRILTDSKSGTATVVYEVGYTLAPCGEKLKSLGVKIPKKKGYEATAYFKKYDQGWVLEHVESE